METIWVTTIRNLMKPQLWKHCPGTENPADLPSRGITTMWLHGPALLQSKDSLIKDEDQDETEGSVPDDCILEMKTKGHSHTLLTNKTNSFKSSRVSSVISPNNYSSIHRPLSVTALVKKFICCHGGRANTESVSKPLLTVDKIKQAHTLWMKDLQIELQKNNRFTYWKQQLGFYLDENGVWRCGGRLTNADIPTDKWNQILLDKAHYITELIVTDTHHRVLHNGVADTLSELQSNLLAGPRKTVRSSTHTCMCLLSQTRRESWPRQATTITPSLLSPAAQAISSNGGGRCRTNVCKKPWIGEPGVVMSLHLLFYSSSPLRTHRRHDHRKIHQMSQTLHLQTWNTFMDNIW